MIQVICRTKTRLWITQILQAVSQRLFLQHLMQVGYISMPISDILKVYDMLFDKENQKKIEDLKLSMNDFMTLVVESATLIINDGEEVEGETMTPAMT